MRFWDSSAIVPLLVREPRTPRLLKLLNRPHALWWGSRTECISALCRVRRETLLNNNQYSKAVAALEKIVHSAVEVEPSGAVRDFAKQLIESHSLRAADALQLAAGKILFPTGGDFITLDERLKTAALAEGFNCP